MTIKTMDEYRAVIRKQSRPSSSSQRTDLKYFVAGFVGASQSAREPDNKANKSLQATN